MGAFRGRTRYPGPIDPKAGWHGSYPPATWTPDTADHTLLAWYQFNFGGIDNGDEVTVINDLSSNRYDVTVTGTEGDDIRFFDNGDGWPYIVHSGSGDKRLGNSGFPALGSAPRTMVVVGEMSDLFLASLGNDADCGKIFALTNNHTVTWCNDVDFTDIPFGSTVVAFFIYDGTNLQVYSNTSQLLTDADPGQIVDTAEGIWLLGWFLDGTFAALEKRLYSVALWDGAFDASEVATAVPYFQNLYPIPDLDWTPDQAVASLRLWIEARNESYSDEDSVDTLHDMSSNSYDASLLHGTVTFRDDGTFKWVEPSEAVMSNNMDDHQFGNDSRTIVLVGEFDSGCMFSLGDDNGSLPNDSIYAITQCGLSRWGDDVSIDCIRDGEPTVVIITHDSTTDFDNVYDQDVRRLTDSEQALSTRGTYYLFDVFASETNSTSGRFYGAAIYDGILTKQERVNAVAYFQQLYS